MRISLLVAAAVREGAQSVITSCGSFCGTNVALGASTWSALCTLPLCEACSSCGLPSSMPRALPSPQPPPPPPPPPTDDTTPLPATPLMLPPPCPPPLAPSLRLNSSLLPPSPAAAAPTVSIPAPSSPEMEPATCESFCGAYVAQGSAPWSALCTLPQCDTCIACGLPLPFPYFPQPSSPRPSPPPAPRQPPLLSPRPSPPPAPRQSSPSPPPPPLPPPLPHSRPPSPPQPYSLFPLPVTAPIMLPPPLPYLLPMPSSQSNSPSSSASPIPHSPPLSPGQVAPTANTSLVVGQSPSTGPSAEGARWASIAFSAPLVVIALLTAAFVLRRCLHRKASTMPVSNASFQNVFSAPSQFAPLSTWRLPASPMSAGAQILPSGASA